MFLIPLFDFDTMFLIPLIERMADMKDNADCLIVGFQEWIFLNTLLYYFAKSA